MHRLALLALVVVSFVVAGCGSDDDAAPATATETTQTSGQNGASGDCRDVEAPAPRDDGGETAPSERLNPEKTYELTFATSCGDFVVTLDQGQSPTTSASLVELARNGFFDDTVFHRIAPGFVIQGGDPQQVEQAGPGYQTRDTPPADAQYVEGVVAMAKTSAKPAGTAGSQFFVVTGEDIGLPADYAIVGTVTEGMDVVRRIGRLGDAAEHPTQPVVIEKVTVTETG